MTDDAILYCDPDARNSRKGVFGFFHRIPFFQEETFIAKIYADSLRDNFLKTGLEKNPDALQELIKLKTAFNIEYTSYRPRLDVFLKIEAQLTQILPADVTKARFWSIIDRFERVVPESSRSQYWSMVPPRGDVLWNDEEFILQQARSLLDVIHANYIINNAREQSTRRLKLVLLLIFVFSSIILCTLLLGFSEQPFVAFATLAYAGMAGGTMSIIQRLQAAVSHDAMMTDGLFELTGLRLGWVGIGLSVINGGVFALVLHFTVMAGLFMTAVPSINISDAAGAVTYTQMRDQLTAQIAIDADRLAGLKTRLAEPDTMPSSPASAAPTDTSGSRQGQAELTTEIAGLEEKQRERALMLNYAKAQANSIAVETAPDTSIGAKFAKNLGLASGSNFFRMLILAFLAGFAERLVPDILERLKKNVAR